MTWWRVFNRFSWIYPRWNSELVPQWGLVCHHLYSPSYLYWSGGIFGYQTHVCTVVLNNAGAEKVHNCAVESVCTKFKFAQLHILMQVSKSCFCDCEIFDFFTCENRWAVSVQLELYVTIVAFLEMTRIQIRFIGDHPTSGILDAMFHRDTGTRFHTGIPTVRQTHPATEFITALWMDSSEGCPPNTIYKQHGFLLKNQTLSR